MKSSLKAVLFLFCLFSVSGLFSKPQSFKEYRSVYSIGKKIRYDGVISFEDSRIIIEYSKPVSSALIFLNDSITVRENGSEKILTSRDNPGIIYFFIILKSIYHNDLKTLSEFFEVSEKKDFTELLPKETAREYIRSVKFRKKGTVLKQLFIELENKDRIQIETAD